MKKQEQQRNLDAFGGELVGVARTVALQQGVPLQLSQIVTELVESVGFGRKLKGREDRLVNLLGRPAANGVATVQEDLQKADDPGVVDLDAGISHGTDGDRQGEALKQGKVHMDIEAFGLESGETVGDDLETFADGVQMIETFL